LGSMGPVSFAETDDRAPFFSAAST
jgi:hypothetical protein